MQFSGVTKSPRSWILPHPLHTSNSRILREGQNRAMNSCSCTIRRQASTEAHDDIATSVVDNAAMSKSHKQLSYTSRKSTQHASTSITRASNSRTPWLLQSTQAPQLSMQATLAHLVNILKITSTSRAIQQQASSTEASRANTARPSDLTALMLAPSPSSASCASTSHAASMWETLILAISSNRGLCRKPSLAVH